MRRAGHGPAAGRWFRGGAGRLGGRLLRGLDECLHKQAAGAAVAVDCEYVFVPAHLRCVDGEDELIAFKAEP